MPMFPKVLVVDDSPVDRQLAGGLLQKDPFIQVEYAENGPQALSQIKEFIPKLVVTDLVMPEMDGLDFVKEVVKRFPLLPVVLMTAHGNGSIAVQALKHGAASYIPKAQLGDRLLGTVQRLVGMVDGQYNYERLVDYQTRAEFSFRLDNKAGLIDHVVGLVYYTASYAHFSDGRGRLQMAEAIEQAMLNALYHGNLELSAKQISDAHKQSLKGNGPNLIDQRQLKSPYRDRRIYFDFSITPEEARFVILDEGPGFDVTTVPPADDPAILERAGGHGLILMQTFMDEVKFNDVGNEVVMVKRHQKGRRALTA